MPPYKRIADICIYSIVSTTIILSISQSTSIVARINKLVSTYNSLPYYIQLSTVFLLGIAIKKLLIYSGDYRLNHEFTPISHLKNIPLRYSILLSSLLLSVHYKLPIHEIDINVIIALILGIVLGGLNDISSLKDREDREDESDYYKEIPVKNKKQDLLQRDKIIRKLINSFEKNHIHTAAILGGFGTGKTSLTHLLESELSSNYLICRINSWGIDPLQIQKTTIENIVERVSHETSCAELKSIAHRFVSNLKGVSTLGLDILSVFDSLQRDPFVQIEKIDNHLLRIDKKILVIIEDIDRHNHSQCLLDELLSLLDKFRTTNSIYALITLGSNSNKDIDQFTSTINRSIGYYEYIPRLNGAQAKNKIIHHFGCVHPIQFKTHSESIVDFWSKPENSIESQAAIELLSSYSNLRELGNIINETLADWDTQLKGQCHLNDLFFMKTLKKFHPKIYDDILTLVYNGSISIQEKIIELINSTVDDSSKKQMLLYFIGNKHRNSYVQTIAFDTGKYIRIIIDHIENNNTTSISSSEENIFNKLYDLFNELPLTNPILLSGNLLTSLEELDKIIGINHTLKYISTLKPNLMWRFVTILLSGASNGDIPTSHISNILIKNDKSVDSKNINMIHKISTRCQSNNYSKFIEIHRLINEKNKTLLDEWFNDEGILFKSYLSAQLNEFNTRGMILNSAISLSVIDVIKKMKSPDGISKADSILNAMKSMDLNESNLNMLKTMLVRLGNEESNLGLPFNTFGFYDDFIEAIEKYQETPEQS